MRSDKLKFRIVCITLGLCAALLPTARSQASIEIFNASGLSNDGTPIAASVKFAYGADAPAGKLVVTLTNTSLADVDTPVDVLTGVFFKLASGTLTRDSAILAGGSTVLFDVAPPLGIVGGEFAFKSPLGSNPYGANAGISSA